jgi:hypothetical protein
MSDHHPPIFGTDRMPEVWKTNRNTDGSAKTNPMLVHGPGPADKQCADCSHLIVYRYSKAYYKCDLRNNSASARTDQRVGWPSCAKFEQAADE